MVSYTVWTSLFRAYLAADDAAHHFVVLFQIGSVEAVISIDFDESCMDQTDEVAEYLNAVDDVLTYYNENAQVKHVCVVQVYLCWDYSAANSCDWKRW